MFSTVSTLRILRILWLRRDTCRISSEILWSTYWGLNWYERVTLFRFAKHYTSQLVPFGHSWTLEVSDGSEPLRSVIESCDPKCTLNVDQGWGRWTKFTRSWVYFSLLAFSDCGNYNEDHVTIVQAGWLLVLGSARLWSFLRLIYTQPFSMHAHIPGYSSTYTCTGKTDRCWPWGKSKDTSGQRHTAIGNCGTTPWIQTRLRVHVCSRARVVMCTTYTRVHTCTCPCASSRTAWQSRSSSRSTKKKSKNKKKSPRTQEPPEPFLVSS